MIDVVHKNIYFNVWNQYFKLLCIYYDDDKNKSVPQFISNYLLVE